MLLILLLCLSGCNKAEKVPALKEETDFSYVDYEVEQRELKEVTYIRGTVQAKQYEQQFVKEGIIDRFFVNPGDKVKKGQLIAALRCKEQQKALESAQRDLRFHRKMAENMLKQQELELRLRKQKVRELQEAGEKPYKIKKLEIELLEQQENLRYQKEKEMIAKKQDEFYIEPEANILESKLANMQEMIGYINGEQVALEYEGVRLSGKQQEEKVKKGTLE